MTGSSPVFDIAKSDSLATHESGNEEFGRETAHHPLVESFW